MSYTKQTWNTGDIITADKLNHMEDGIGSVTVVELEPVQSSNQVTPSKSVNDIKALIKAGKPVVFSYMGLLASPVLESTGDSSNPFEIYILFDTIQSFFPDDGQLDMCEQIIYFNPSSNVGEILGHRTYRITLD